MAQTFDTDYITKLNLNYGAGKFLKAVILTETYEPLVKTYWIDHEDPLVFQGNTYSPIHMLWKGIKASAGMPTEGFQVVVSNLPSMDAKGEISQAGRYIKHIDVSGNEIIIQLLHLDLLATLTQYWKRKAKVLAIKADINAVAFSVGRSLGHERLPRSVILKDRYPGLSSDVPRIL
jgi:hypothetical protein